MSQRKHNNSFRGRRTITMSTDPAISDALYASLDSLMADAHIFNERGDISLSVFLRMLGWAAESNFSATLDLVQQIADLGQYGESNYRIGVNPRRGQRYQKEAAPSE